MLWSPIALRLCFQRALRNVSITLLDTEKTICFDNKCSKKFRLQIMKMLISLFVVALAVCFNVLIRVRVEQKYTKALVRTGPLSFFEYLSQKWTDFNNYLYRNPEAISHQNIINLYTLPVKCSHYTFKNSREKIIVACNLSDSILEKFYIWQ